MDHGMVTINRLSIRLFLGEGRKEPNASCLSSPLRKACYLSCLRLIKVFIKGERHESVGGGEKRARGYFSFLPPKEGLILELSPSCKGIH